MGGYGSWLGRLCVTRGRVMRVGCFGTKKKHKRGEGDGDGVTERNRGTGIGSLATELDTGNVDLDALDATGYHPRSTREQRIVAVILEVPR